MHKAAFALLALAFCASAQALPPQATVLANSIDLSQSASYIDTLKALGFRVETISAGQLPEHQADPLLLVLGGQNSPEGVGRIVDGLMTREEKEATVKPAAKTLVILNSVWAERQKVLIFAGYGKEQTRKMFSEAQGDIIKSLKFNESLYPENNTVYSSDIPPLDATQPYTEVDAAQAAAIREGIPGVEVIDVRGVPFYAAGHIPGAVNIQESKMKDRLSELPKERTYLLYCGGNSESIAAGNLLASNGYAKLYRLVDGYMAWRKAGYPKEK